MFTFYRNTWVQDKRKKYTKQEQQDIHSDMQLVKKGDEIYGI